MTAPAGWVLVRPNATGERTVVHKGSYPTHADACEARDHLVALVPDIPFTVMRLVPEEAPDAVQ